MATKKNYYYVIVMTEEGPKFVTGIPSHNMAEYDMLEKPMLFGSRDFADDVSQGLTLNMIPAFTVVLRYELEHQPYRYSEGHLTWVNNKEEN